MVFTNLRTQDLLVMLPTIPTLIRSEIVSLPGSSLSKPGPLNTLVVSATGMEDPGYAIYISLGYLSKRKTMSERASPMSLACGVRTPPERTFSWHVLPLEGSVHISALHISIIYVL